MLVGAVVGGGLEHLLVAGDETVAAVVLLGNRPREVLHDRPRGVGAELVAPRKVELLDGADQAHVAVGDQLEKVIRRADVPLGNRDDQPKIRPDDLVLDGQGVFLKLLDPIEIRVLARVGSMV